MRCPFCGNPETQVKDSRPSEDGAAIRRRRSCSECGGRFTTFERVQLRELIIVKRSGRRTPFDREKLERSISIALRKRDVEPDRVDRMVSAIVRQLESLGESDIPSEVVGEMIMKALRAVDEVAYVRYASVYRDFRETADFARLLIDEFDGDGDVPPARTAAPHGNPDPEDPRDIKRGLGEQDLSSTDDA
ncbi:transcriptional regulator NrdR [Asticcacaulis aquaticus]|uniref:transcriptional regulator NrdR n=1 Tax=Asticcacaulis aquaticus TaxID=2984212 RepID=UPI003F6052B7